MAFSKVDFRAMAMNLYKFRLRRQKDAFYTEFSLLPQPSGVHCEGLRLLNSSVNVTESLQILRREW